MASPVTARPAADRTAGDPEPSATAKDPRIPIGKSARSLAAQVADRIQGDIILGQLEPGDHLKETALAEEHAVSRATIREALIALEKRGVIERIPRSGARVATFNRADLEALYQARASILALSATACAERGDAALAGRLTGLAQEMQALATADAASSIRHAELVIEAQRLLAEGGANRYLAEFHEQLLNMALSRLVREQGLAFQRPERRAESARDWMRIARAVARRDGAGAAAAVQTLMAHSAEAVRAQLARRGEGRGR